MEKAKKEKSEKVIEIIPLRDFEITHNEFSYKLVKGEKIGIDARFLENLKTEKVIK